MMELLAAEKPVCTIGLAHRADDHDAFSYWIWELRRFKSTLEEKFRIEITPARLTSAIREMNTERRLRRELSELMAQPSPPLTGRELLRFKSIISCIPEDIAWYKAALDLLGKITPKPDRHRKVRVLITGVPMVNGAERVIELIESCDAIVVAMENCTGLKPILEDVDETAADPLEAIARKYFHLPCSVMTPNTRRLESLRQLAGKFRPDCIIDLVWHACLTYDIESAQVRKLAEGELKLPLLKLNTDYSEADSARIRTQVEALIETVRARGFDGLAA